MDISLSFLFFLSGFFSSSIVAICYSIDFLFSSNFANNIVLHSSHESLSLFEEDDIDDYNALQTQFDQRVCALCFVLMSTNLGISMGNSPKRYLCLFHLITAGLLDENIGSDEQEIVEMIYLIIDLDQIKVDFRNYSFDTDVFDRLNRR